MNTASAQTAVGTEATLIRLGGVAGLLILGLYILINFILMGFSGPSGVPPGELKTYVAHHAGTMAIANGLRFLALFCTAFFAVGMYAWTSRGTLAANGWGILGMLGATALIGMGVITNTVQSLAFLTFARVSEQPEHFLLLWNLSRLLFRMAQLLSGLMIAGFSIAGWQSATVPTWLVVPGLLFAASGLLTAVGIAWTMSDSRAVEPLLLARDFLAMFWFLCVSVLMVRRASA